MRSQRTILAVVVAIVGVIALVVGIIYLTTAARSLPSILGPIHMHGHRSRRGIAAVIVGGVLLVAGAALAYRPRRKY